MNKLIILCGVAIFAIFVVIFIFARVLGPDINRLNNRANLSLSTKSNSGLAAAGPKIKMDSSQKFEFDNIKGKVEVDFKNK
ncbi:MAG: hypothetical protein LBV08_05510 [Clostridiales bacterium]|jgi:hypothetical protein|nr:hypothetical protein [Clostridiales bacterium]